MDPSIGRRSTLTWLLLCLLSPPARAQSPEPRTAGGWLGEPSLTKVSVFALNFTYSTSHQLTLQLKSDAWVPGNTWNFKGDWRYLDLAQSTYGLGPTVDQAGEYPMTFVMWRLYETA